MAKRNSEPDTTTAAPTVDVHHFASSVPKVTAKGDVVLSNYISKGETLTNGVTFEEVLQGILTKEQPVKHQDSTFALTTDETITHTQQVTTDKAPEGEKVELSAQTDEKPAPSQGDSGPAETVKKDA
jgi:hypothetical protein